MYARMNEAASLEADLHSKIGDKGQARQIQVKDGFMGLSMWIEQDRSDQSVGIAGNHSRPHGITRHQQLGEKAGRWVT